MHGRLFAALLLLGPVGCAGMQHGGRGAAADGVAVDEDGIPLNATPQERERLRKSQVCTMERPIGSNIPERVCRLTSSQPSMPMDDLNRPQQQAWGPGGK